MIFRRHRKPKDKAQAKMIPLNLFVKTIERTQTRLKSALAKYLLKYIRPFLATLRAQWVPLQPRNDKADDK